MLHNPCCCPQAPTACCSGTPIPPLLYLSITALSGPCISTAPVVSHPFRHTGLTLFDRLPNGAIQFGQFGIDAMNCTFFDPAATGQVLGIGIFGMTAKLRSCSPIYASSEVTLTAGQTQLICGGPGTSESVVLIEITE